jgi:hypothetical protein
LRAAGALHDGGTVAGVAGDGSKDVRDAEIRDIDGLVIRKADRKTGRPREIDDECRE